MKAARKLGYRSEAEMQQAESQEGLAQLRRAQRLATPLRQASQLLESTPDDPPSDRDASSSSTTRLVAPPAAPMLPSRPRASSASSVLALVLSYMENRIITLQFQLESTL